MANEAHKWYHADKAGGGRLTKKRKRGYVRPVEVKASRRMLYRHSGAKP